MTEWISVKDKLPEHDQKGYTKYTRVIVYLAGHGIHIRWFSFGLFFSKHYDAWQYSLDKHSAYARKALKKVKYWQNLPDHPQETSDKSHSRNQ